jgi:hypothetical protein
MFQNRVLRKLFEPRRDEITGGGRNCIMRSCINLYSVPNRIRMIKSRRVGYIACI